jgi:hypothetical protein
MKMSLARMRLKEQQASVGNQTGGRVFIFLETDDFWRDYNRLVERGVVFARSPSDEPYGTVAVFEDLYGNRFDLIQRKGRDIVFYTNGSIERFSPCRRQKRARDRRCGSRVRSSPRCSPARRTKNVYEELDGGSRVVIVRACSTTTAFPSSNTRRSSRSESIIAICTWRRWSGAANSELPGLERVDSQRAGRFGAEGRAADAERRAAHDAGARYDARRASGRVDIEVVPEEVERDGRDAFEKIGEEVTETGERRPASLVVVRVHKPKFVRKDRERSDETEIVVAPPELPIPRGLAGPAFLADAIVRRWQDHLPFLIKGRSYHTSSRQNSEDARSWQPGLCRDCLAK